MGDQAVKRIDIGLGRRNDNIAICTTASKYFTICCSNTNSYLAQSIDSARNALNGKFRKLVFVSTIWFTA